MKKTIWIYIIVIIIGAGGIWYAARHTTSAPGKLDAFAQCLATSGAKFYGAFWCPHCQNQKKLFGSSVKYLPYIECSNPDGQSQNGVCNAAKITGYPTWEFKDGSRLSGEQSLATLAEKTSCVLPAN